MKFDERSILKPAQEEGDPFEASPNPSSTLQQARLIQGAMDSDSDDDTVGALSTSSPVIPKTQTRQSSSSSSSDSDDMPPLEDDATLSDIVDENKELLAPEATQASNKTTSTSGEATPKPSEAAQIIPDIVTTRSF